MDEDRNEHRTEQSSEHLLSTRVAAPVVAGPAHGGAQDGADEVAALRRQLRESTERITALATAASQIVWATGPFGEGGDLPYWRAYTGQQAEEVRGRGWLLAVHPDDRERTMVAWRQAVATTTTYQTTYRLRRADGVYRWFESRAVPVLEDDGRLREWVGCCVDVDDRERLLESERAARVRAEQARGAAEELAAQMEAIFAAMTDGVAVYDAEAHLLRMNPALRHMLAVRDEAGYAAEPLDQRADSFQLHRLRTAGLPSDEWVRRRVIAGEELTGERSLDIVFTAPDAREVLLNLAGAPVHAPDGSITGGVIVVRDMTATRMLERRTHAALAALLEMAEALVRTPLSEHPDDSEQGSMRQQARHLARLTHRVLPSEQVALVTVDEAANRVHSLAVVGLPPKHVAEWQATFDAVPLDAYLEAQQIEALRSGDVLVIDLTTSPRREVSRGATTSLLAPMRLGGRLIGALVVHAGEGHEYTAPERELAAAVAKLAALVVERERLLRERAEARGSALALREANRRMDEFLGIAGHELRTPLTTVKASVQMSARLLAELRHSEDMATERQAQTLARVASLLERAQRQADRENRLVNDLLDVSRIQGGKLELRTQRCDLLALVREAVEEQRLAHPQRAITLALPRVRRRLDVEADADRISQVITNYLTNALKYAPAGQITVRVERRAGAVRVSVRDSGPGLPAGEQERVWERFYRVPDAGEGEAPIGMGIGLFLCKSLVERHGGRVGVESVPGAGAAFWFELPLSRR